MQCLWLSIVDIASDLIVFHFLICQGNTCDLDCNSTFSNILGVLSL